MKIKINGKTEVISDNINNLSMLIDFLEGKIPKLFAIEKNGKIIYKENYKKETLKENDEIEIVMFCGGG